MSPTGRRGPVPLSPVFRRKSERPHRRTSQVVSGSSRRVVRAREGMRGGVEVNPELRDLRPGWVHKILLPLTVVSRGRCQESQFPHPCVSPSAERASTSSRLCEYGGGSLPAQEDDHSYPPNPHTSLPVHMGFYKT